MAGAVSVTACNLDREHSKMGTIKVGKAQLDGQVGGAYTLRYIVRTASAASPISVIINAQSLVAVDMDTLPRLWSGYTYKGDSDAYSFLKSFDVERSPNCDTLYYVTCNYEPAEEGEMPETLATPRESIANPLIRKARLWWDREIFSNIPTLDNAGKVIALPTKTLHDDIIEKDRSRAILVVEWNIGTFALFSALHQDFENARNSTAWSVLGRTFGPKTAVVRQISCSQVKTEGAYNYYTASMRFAFAETGKTWVEQMPLLARQFYKIGSGNTIEEETPGVYKRYSSADLVPIETNGTRRLDTQDIAYQTVDVYRDMNFNVLPFMSLLG